MQLHRGREEAGEGVLSAYGIPPAPAARAGAGGAIVSMSSILF